MDAHNCGRLGPTFRSFHRWRVQKMIQLETVSWLASCVQLSLSDAALICYVTCAHNKKGIALRVFVSSTCYDLLDVRAELAQLLVSIGIVPVLSDDKLSDFKVPLDLHSIQACLVNIESCDAVILLLDQRYGPSLEKTGVSSVSATHEEYRHAVKCKKPIYVYVRDKTVADHRIWEQNKERENLKLTWVKNPADWKLFDLLSEHAKLTKDLTRSNWFTSFSTSVDLKAAVSKSFEADLLKHRIVELINNNRFPIVSAAANVETNQRMRAHPRYSAQIDFKNSGGAPAFNLRLKWADEEEWSLGKLLSVGESVPICLSKEISYDVAQTAMIDVCYEAAIGVKMIEQYELTTLFQRHDFRFGVRQLSKEYARIPPLEVELS